jgi:hypothetical protein
MCRIVSPPEAAVPCLLGEARRGLRARRHECEREEISMPFTGNCHKRVPLIVKCDAVRDHDSETFVGFLAGRLVDLPYCPGKASSLPEPAAKTAVHFSAHRLRTLARVTGGTPRRSSAKGNPRAVTPRLLRYRRRDMGDIARRRLTRTRDSRAAVSSNERSRAPRHHGLPRMRWPRGRDRSRSDRTPTG